MQLGDVDPSKVFRTCNGVVIRNIFELATYLASCSDYDFKYHVNDNHHKNDFAIWVREVVEDELLARNKQHHSVPQNTRHFTEYM